MLTIPKSYSKKLETKKRKKLRFGRWAPKKRRVWTSILTPLLVVEIISSNKTIPIIQTTSDGRITSSTNISEEITNDSLKNEQASREMKEKGNRIKINYTEDAFNYIFYGESTVFAELREVLHDQIESFNKDITSNSASAPVIYATENDSILDYGNLDSVSMQYSSFVTSKIA